MLMRRTAAAVLAGALPVSPLFAQDEVDISPKAVADDPVAPRYFGLHEEMGSKLMGDEVTLALNALSPAFRTVVLLDLEDFTYEEIAAILEIPIGTVRSRLHRARNVLAEKLREYAEAQGFNVQDDDQERPVGNTNDDAR